MAHNTTYHQTLKCSPTEVFHGRVPHNALDLKFSNPLNPPRNAVDTRTLVDNLNSKFKETHTNIVRAFHKYKAYYDRKAQASPLKVNDFAFLLSPKIATQSDKIPFNSFKWEGPYKVVKVLSHSNYIIRKVGTFRTQCVHRMRLRPFVPHDPIDDIDDDAKKHYSDPDATDDQTIFNENLPAPDILTPAENTPELDVNEPEEINTEHGTFYYERERMHEVPPLPEPLRDTIHTNNTDRPESESPPEEIDLPITDEVDQPHPHLKRPNQSHETTLLDIALEKHQSRKHTMTSSFMNYIQNQH